MKQIDEIWFGLDEDRKTVDMSKLRNDKRILRVATTVTDMPFSYIKDGKNVGYDIDLIVRFCLEKGYGLELVDVDFAGRIPEVESGKCDFSTDMNVTPERQEQVLFSEPTSKGGIVLAVRTADLKENKRSDSAVYTSVDELAGKRIGVTTGSIHDRLIAKRLPSAEIMYFTGLADLPVALKARQIDAFVAPESAVIWLLPSPRAQKAESLMNSLMNILESSCRMERLKGSRKNGLRLKKMPRRSSTTVPFRI